MEKRTLQIYGIPAIIYGTSSRKVFLYVHGQGGYKEEAENFANIACQFGYQVLSVDLPEHGDRKGVTNSFDPWHIVPELSSMMDYAKSQWKYISLFANSIGAWFSMLSLEKEKLEKCLFVSPVLDMKQLISKMMVWANVSEARLKEERVIPTTFGHTLTWEYWTYTLSHPIVNWTTPTRILYGENDSLIERDTVDQFVRKYHCKLTVMEKGEHRFHTEQQLAIMSKWVRKELNSKLILRER